MSYGELLCRARAVAARRDSTCRRKESWADTRTFGAAHDRAARAIKRAEAAANARAVLCEPRNMISHESGV
jgi:hypothetical protein